MNTCRAEGGGNTKGQPCLRPPTCPLTPRRGQGRSPPVPMAERCRTAARYPGNALHHEMAVRAWLTQHEVRGEGVVRLATTTVPARAAAAVSAWRLRGRGQRKLGEEFKMRSGSPSIYLCSQIWFKSKGNWEEAAEKPDKTREYFGKCSRPLIGGWNGCWNFGMGLLLEESMRLVHLTRLLIVMA